MFFTVIALCLNTDEQRREVMMAALNLGMNTDEYVFIFVENRWEGFGILQKL